MNVSLTPELERLVQEKVSSGLYNNQSEVVRESLRRFFARERANEDYLEYLRASVRQGIEQAARGELLSSQAVVDEMRQLLQSDRD